MGRKGEQVPGPAGQPLQEGLVKPSGRMRLSARVAKAAATLNVGTALVDGELVALDNVGISSFPASQAALSGGKDGTLHFQPFDLLHLDGWDFRACALLERKRVLQGLDDWRGMLR